MNVSTNKSKSRYNQFAHRLNSLTLLWGIVVAFGLYACNSTSGNTGTGQSPLPALPAITLTQVPATTYQEFSASLEGTTDVEIRPQVEGYLDKILVDEGAFVKKGQVLFIINDRPYREQLNNASANLAAAQANLLSADINVSKLEPLVDGNIISPIQLKTAKANQSGAAAVVAQSKALVQNASINVGYTQVKSPVDGYVGRIPFKAGSLVGLSNPQALTVVSAVKNIYAYFSFSEKDFLRFKDQFAGASLEDKIKQMPLVDLVLADNSLYAEKGKVEIVSGQFDNHTGAISFRASFPNTDGILRSGITGKIRLPQVSNESIAVPMEATFELQDKVFVFVLDSKNVATSTPLSIHGRAGNYYLVDKGLKAGDRIVFAGLDRLKDGAAIQPQLLSLDSIIKANPL